MMRPRQAAKDLAHCRIFSSCHIGKMFEEAMQPRTTTSVRLHSTIITHQTQPSMTSLHKIIEQV